MNKRNKIRFGIILLCLMVLTLGSCAFYRFFPTTVTVLGSAASTASKITVESGDSISIVATGTIEYHPEYDATGPDGDSVLGTPNEIHSDDSNSALGYPLPDEPIGALVGRIGSNGAAFLIGESYTFTAESTGELYFVVNDNYFDNNSGSFEVTVIFE